MEKITVYVGGCYNLIQDIRSAQKLFVENGLEVSYDWTKRAEMGLPRTPNNLATDAELDIKGVLKANWTVLIMTSEYYVYRGTFTELGASIVRDIQRNTHKTIIVGGPKTYAADCCFWHHPNLIHCDTIEEALDRIKMLNI